MVEAYWNIGKSIIEEQGGNKKAEYGTGLLKELSKQMTQDFGKGFTVANLKNMWQFYLTFPNSYAMRSELSWTHYRLLMGVENDNAREFYISEAVKSQWSTRQLERQINSFFYERLLSSKDKERVAAEIQTLEHAKEPEDIIRDSYVLQFLGLNPNNDFLRKRFGTGANYAFAKLAGAFSYAHFLEGTHMDGYEKILKLMREHHHRIGCRGAVGISGESTLIFQKLLFTI